jgi:hypothetical protein
MQIELRMGIEFSLWTIQRSLDFDVVFEIWNNILTLVLNAIVKHMF